MEKQNHKLLRVMIVASSSTQRAALAETMAHALGERAHITPASQFSQERFIATASELLIADLDTPAAAGNMLRFLQQAAVSVGTIALMDDPDGEWIGSALNASINAILARDAGPEDLLMAVQAAEAGLVLLHPASVRGLFPDQFRPAPDGSALEELTGREGQVLRLVSAGLGNKEIAARLAISEHTVKFHISSILGKMNVTSRTEAVSLGIRRGLIPI